MAAAAGLGLAACAQAAKIPEGPLSREVAAGLAASGFVDDEIVSSIRTVGEPLGAPPSAANEASPGGGALDLAGCLPMLAGADSDADGYPSVEETLPIDCDLFIFHIGGTLVLLDKNDEDPTSGFRSQLDFRMMVTAEDEAHLFAAGKRVMDVDAMATGAYGLSYNGGFASPTPGEPFSEAEVRLTYVGTLQGTFEGGTLAIDDGTFSFAAVPVDCSMLAGAEQQACQANTPENTAPPLEVAVASTGIVFDKASCDTALTGGYFDMRDDSGNVLRISYSGCGERSATYNGEMITIPPPEE